MVDPILLEIVAGTLASVEAEVETAIGRTARSPMIRDAHDFRAGIHDVQMRKLTGRSYSALVQPVVRDYPIEQMQPGDVYFHNDVYLSEGGIGHLPDLCVTVPVFHDGQVVAFVQAFGHHDDIGGTVPGSMPSHATSVFEEGLMVPPIKLWAAGVPNEAALKIMTRNSRMPESLGRRSGCRVLRVSRWGPGGWRTCSDRYGRDAIDAAFEEILQSTTTDLPHRAVVQDPRRRVRLGGLRGARRGGRAAVARAADHPDQAVGRRRCHRRPADPGFHRHLAAGQGADQPLRGLCGRRVPGQMAGADPAQSRRLTRADGRTGGQRGGGSPDRDAFSAKGNAAHADLPGADERPHLRHPADCWACWPGCWPRPSTVGCPPTRRRSATPACTAATRTGSRT